MYVFWKLILVLLLTTWGLCFTVRIDAGSSRTDSEELVPEQHPSVVTAPKDDEQVPVQSSKRDATVKVKRDSFTFPDNTYVEDDSSSPFWSWLTGREKPDPCMMASVGGAIGGGALTGAFVGAGIGSIFPGPGTIVGAAIGGITGLFGGVSFGHRAAAAVCPCVAVDAMDQCIPNE